MKIALLSRNPKLCSTRRLAERGTGVWLTRTRGKKG